MRLKTMFLAGATLATVTIAAPAFAASASAAPTVSPQHSQQALTGDDSGDVSGIRGQDSPVCSALGAETIPTGSVVAKCLAGTRIV